MGLGFSLVELEALNLVQLQKLAKYYQVAIPKKATKAEMAKVIWNTLKGSEETQLPDGSSVSMPNVPKYSVRLQRIMDRMKVEGKN